MRLVSYNGQRLGVLTERGVVDISDLAPASPGYWPPVGMVQLIARFADHRAEIERRAAIGPFAVADAVSLEAPIQWPNKLIAYPANYTDHIDEMHSKFHKYLAPANLNDRADSKGFFLKANSSLSGPNDEIVLPEAAAGPVHHEAELAVVIGRTGRNIPRERALDHVFGYTCLLDMTVRGQQERVMRKSHDTFTPIGPWLRTADEVPDPAALRIQLTVNGEIRQKARVADMIVDVPEQIASASAVATLFPGDIIASGTPAGVGPVVDGDEIRVEIDGVGAMSLLVVGPEGRGQR